MHTPASYQWKGKKLESAATDEERKALVAETVKAMREAEPDVFVVMDYWTFDGYLAIKKYVSVNPGSLGNKVVMPGIEIRVESSLKGQRLNVHFVLDGQLTEQQLVDMYAILKISLQATKERNLSNECLIEWARSLGTDKLNRHSYDAGKVASDNLYALEVGRNTAEVTAESVRNVLNSQGDKILFFMPWDTYGGMSNIDWCNHYAEVRRFMCSANIFECKNVASREAFHGVKTANNEHFYDNFWNSIERKPRLCVRGTDAHTFAEYGNFPSGMKTWLKAEPTFLGLKQAIKEPASRSFIGDIPPKKALVDAKGSLFLDKLKVTKKTGHLPGEDWFDGLDVELNPDLVAIIGNKGSGKSALADVLALAGNSKLHSFFTFLNPHRFHKGAVKRATAFDAEIYWRNGEKKSSSLDSQPQKDAPERVRYISQQYFEELCNDHISGRSNRFEQEIKSVLFSNMDQAERQNHESLDAYLAAQEQGAQDRIKEIRSKLKDLNSEIAFIDECLTQEYRDDLQAKLAQKELLKRDLEAKRPVDVLAPATNNNTETTPENNRLAEISELQLHLDTQIKQNEAQRKRSIEQRQALVNAKDQLALFEAKAAELNSKIIEDLSGAGIDIDNPIQVSTKRVIIEELAKAETVKTTALADALIALNTSSAALNSEKEAIQQQLDAPTKAYQLYLSTKKAWDDEMVGIVGSQDEVDTLTYFQHKIDELAKLPEKRESLQAKRTKLSLEIYDELNAIAESRKILFSPVNELVAQYPEVGQCLRIDFQSRLIFDSQTFIGKFFEMVKKSTGGFRNDAGGEVTLERMIRDTDFDSRDSVGELLNSICSEITNANTGRIPLKQVLRTKITIEQLYELLFDLSQLSAKFSLSLAGTTMEQLSPGQRGALLLIFYLLVDKDQSPLVLDQPEENLDNQTVFSMLVPIIKKSKEYRQIIMVTHNANLAVCCDAEQIIHAEFDRAQKFKLSYTCGPIEAIEVNNTVVNVLEGTEPAFKNRESKYFSVI